MNLSLIMSGECDRMKKKTYRRKCCVVGCVNREGTESLIFYRFPQRDPERKQQWVSAVGRINPDGTAWCPNGNARICSAHFVDGCKGTLRADKNYLPTIFPIVTNDRKTSKRRKYNTDNTKSGPTAKRPNGPDCLPSAIAPERRLDTQSDPGCIPVVSQKHLSVCNTVPTLYKKIQTFDGTTKFKKMTKGQMVQQVSEKSDSTLIKEEPGSPNPDEDTTLDTMIECTPELVKIENNLIPFTELIDASVQTDISFSGFGLKNLRTDEEFRSWCGITKASFVALEGILNWKVSESYLFLCLVKLKQNLTFRAMSSLFQIQRGQAFDIFVEVLNILYDNAKLFSPSKIEEATSPFKTDFKCVVGTSSEGCERLVRFLLTLDDQDGKIISVSRRTSDDRKLQNIEPGQGT